MTFPVGLMIPNMNSLSGESLMKLELTLTEFIVNVILDGLPLEC